MQLPVKLAIGFATLFFIGVIFGFVAFPKMLKSQIAKNVALLPGSEMRAMWSKVPFPVDFKIYMFNVTNPEQVTKGALPIVQEVGPYFYDEWKEKLNMEDNETDDTVSFNPRTHFFFNQEKSGRLTGNELITTAHPLIMGLGIVVSREKPAMLSLIKKALNSIFDNPKTPFITAPVKDILFDGITINCNRTDFAAKAMCTALKTEVKGLIIVDDVTYKISFFSAKNGTLEGRFKVKRGHEKVRDLGRVMEYEGKPTQAIWSGPECNDFQGTDSTIFAPFLTPKDELVSFTPDMCRSLGAYYVKPEKYAGIPVNRYTADLGDMSTDKKLKCFCPTPDTCLKKGVMDLQKCTGSPVIASLPHFYEADPIYKAGVIGLNPNKEDHEIFIDFESITGTPVSARKRLQFNMPLEKVEKIDTLKDLPGTLMPMFWVEEGISLNSTYTDVLKHDLFRTMKIVSIIKWLMMVIGLVGCGAAALLHYKRKVGFKVTPTHGTAPTTIDPNSITGNQKGSNVISTVSGGGGALDRTEKGSTTTLESEVLGEVVKDT